jgi:CRP-like cAMP-binding protein
MDKKTLKENTEAIEYLKGLPTLKFFTEKNMNNILHFSKIKKFKPGDVIIEEGGYDKWVYFLISGKVKVIKQGEEIDVLQRTGDLFGEMRIIDKSPRSASVSAADKVVCLAMDISLMDNLVADDQVAFFAIFYHIMAEVLAGRLRETSEELVQEQLMKDILSNRLKQTNEELTQAKEELSKLKK